MILIKQANPSSTNLEFGSSAPGATKPSTIPKPAASAAPAPWSGNSFMSALKPIGSTAKGLMQQGLPPQMNQAMGWHKTLQDPNLNWMSQEKWDAADNLTKWLDQNKNHSMVSKIYNSPAAQQQLSSYNSPLGQIGRTVGPAIGNFFGQDPKRMATILSMPGIKEMFEGTLGRLGTPGLAMAHSYLSGNMRNWNTLFGKQSSSRSNIPIYNVKRQRDVIDHHIELVQKRS